MSNLINGQFFQVKVMTSLLSWSARCMPGKNGCQVMVPIFHENGPELEVYFKENKIEYWIPIREK